MFYNTMSFNIPQSEIIINKFILPEQAEALRPSLFVGLQKHQAISKSNINFDDLSFCILASRSISAICP